MSNIYMWKTVGKRDRWYGRRTQGEGVEGRGTRRTEDHR